MFLISFYLPLIYFLLKTNSSGTKTAVTPTEIMPVTTIHKISVSILIKTVIFE